MTIEIPSTLHEYDPERQTGGMLNGVMVKRAAEAMENGGYNSNYSEDVSDAIADLLHLAHARAQNPAEVLRAAVRNFLTEVGHDPNS